MQNIPDLSEKDFKLFQKLIVEESGLYFDRNRSQSLNDALWRRLQDQGYDSYHEYYNLLKSHPEGKIELPKLFNLITIGETYFFRNKPHFEALMRSALPEIIERKKLNADRSFRVWSAGCSKGDEAYSIAIAIMETLPDYESWDISILGTDINRDVLDRAEAAVYKKRDIAQMPKEYLNKYFTSKDNHYLLNEDVKKLARFKYHNLSKDSLALEETRNLDIIFCRNVIIYFDLPAIKQLIDKFYNSLSPAGYLFLGHSENLWQISTKFATVEFPQTFIYKKPLYPVEKEASEPFIGIPWVELETIPLLEQTDKQRELPVQQEPLLDLEGKKESPPEPIIDKEEEACEALYKKGVKLFNEKKYQAALDIFDKIIAQHNHIRTYFAKATILANQAKYDEAIQELQKIIESDNLYIEAYYLLGTLLYKTGDFQGAEVQFRKVIYIDPNTVIAYFNLGNINLCQNKYIKATREFNNVIKLLEPRSKEEPIKFCESFTADFLLRACKQTLSKIKI